MRHSQFQHMLRKRFCWLVGLFTVTALSCSSTSLNGSVAGQDQKPALAQGQQLDGSAVYLYNEGCRLLKEQNFSHAAEKFKEALRFAPDSCVIHTNYGDALFRMGRYDEAKAELIKATDLQPTAPTAFLNLGSCYQELGDIPQALQALNTYLKLAPASQKTVQVQAIVTALQNEAQHEQLPTRVPVSKDDYLANATLDGIVRWPAPRMPIPVCIKPATGVAGYRPELATVLKECFDEWQGASEGMVRFKFVDIPASYGISCLWTDDPAKIKTLAEGGHAHPTFDQDGIASAEITLLTQPAVRLQGETVQSNNHARMIDLHEIGHALGIGHSRAPGDIMFPSVSATDSNCHLSQRDKNTLVALYQLDASKLTKRASHMTASGIPTEMPADVLKLNTEAQQAIAQGDLLLAVDKLRQAQKLAPEHRAIMINLGTVYSMLANEAAGKSDWPQADNYYKLAIPLIESSGDKGRLIKALTNYQSILSYTNRTAEAEAIESRLKTLKAN